MTRSIEPTPSNLPQQTALSIDRYTGEVVYVYAFDVAYEMTRQPITQILGQPVAQFVVDASKRSPRQLFFYRPQMVRLPPLERIGPHGAVRVERTIKLFPVGAISITVRVPFQVNTLEDLVAYHDLHFSNGSLYEEVRQLAQEVQRELSGYFIRPNDGLSDEEAYTVFCIKNPPSSSNGQHLSSEDWLHDHRRQVAALLTQEPNIDHLSDQEASESTGRYLSYYDYDLVVVDWDAALILDQPGNFDEILHIMELANLQLAELEAYDRLLDETVERSYRDVSARRMKNRAQIMRQLSEIRIDLARLSDELSNTTKFFGDWHLARIYQALSSRFHLSDWHKTVDEKLKTLDDMYQLLKQDHNNRWMMVLEVTIVLLFIIDLVILFLGPK
ncbi:MAG TPA: hypothetical protein VHP11_02600, partial [Tepidisphaeraceae bacterium]|nr:hypothetical protein [Tepidisphaeraceae bacterium]